MNPVLMLAVGVAGGLIGGVFGVGGGIIVVPVLVMFMGFSQHLAQGTMLATLLLPSFVFAVWTYYKAGHIHWPAAILVSLGMMIGSVLGARYAQTVPAPILKKMFGLLMIVSGIKLVFWK